MFIIQVKNKEGVWEGVHPSWSTELYRWPTREEAESIMRMLYPDQVVGERFGEDTTVRVIEEDYEQ